MPGAGRAFYGDHVYTVSRAAELTGVPSGTLRKWEQRYGVVAPQRSPGNYRLYDDEAVRRLSVMRSLVDNGWSAHEAAWHVVHDAATAEAEVPRPEVPTADSRVDELALCAADFDVPRLEKVLAEAFADDDVVAAVDEWLLPSLVRLTNLLGGAVAVITGRRLADIDALLGPLPVPVAAMHGAAIRLDVQGALL